jgi:HNH endonuclease
MTEIAISFSSSYANFSQLNKFIPKQKYSSNSIMKNVIKKEFKLLIKEVKDKYQIPTIIDPDIFNDIHINHTNERLSKFADGGYCAYLNYPNNKLSKITLSDNENIILCVIFTSLDCTFKKANRLIKETNIIIGKTHKISYNDKNITGMDASLKIIGQTFDNDYKFILTKIIIETPIIVPTMSETMQIEKIIIETPIIVPTANKSITTDEQKNVKKSKVKINDSESIEIKSQKKIPASVRTAVWKNEFEDNGVGKCYVGCGENISVHNYECGHIISRKKGGDNTISNLKPICGRCNKSMGTQNLEDFIKEHGFKD